MVESISCFFFRTWRVPKSAHCATYCHLFEVLEGSIYRIYIYKYILYILYIYIIGIGYIGLRVPLDLHGHLPGPPFFLAPAKRDTLCIHCVAKAVQAPEAKPALKRSTPWQRSEEPSAVAMVATGMCLIRKKGMTEPLRIWIFSMGS